MNIEFPVCLLLPFSDDVNDVFGAFIKHKQKIL